MLVLKKKEIVACALVVLIGVAGYLNWSYQDTVRVTDGDDYIETGKKLGEAQYVNSEKSNVEYESEEDTKVENNETVETAASADYFVQAKMEKENSRSKALEILNKTAENESFDEETRKNAQQKILDMASNTEKEAVIENIAKAKGYNDISVYIDGDEADIIVKKDGFGEKDVNILKELVSEQLNISPNNIKIVEKTK
ncbi:MAG: SpoIIIAH-like family protein [Clostridia bacterium]|nr:SpoIIIAH-like family protein [Clostridia bacterium]